MPRIIRPAIIAILLLLAVSSLARVISIADFEDEIYKLTNYERRKEHLPDLAYDTGLADLARRHSKNMASADFFDHKDREGLRVGGRVEKYYPAMFAASVGENIAFFQVGNKVFNASEIVEGWMNSPPHRAAILNGDFTYIGVGVVLRGDKLYATQNFARTLYKLLSNLPEKPDQCHTYVVEFEYMGVEDPATLQATLDVPDRKQEIPVGGNRYRVGSEPREIEWLDDRRFRVNLDFRFGRGKYLLRFGWDGSFYSEGISFKVK